MRNNLAAITKPKRVKLNLQLSRDITIYPKTQLKVLLELQFRLSLKIHNKQVQTMMK